MEQIQQHEWVEIKVFKRYLKCKKCHYLYDTVMETYIAISGKITEEEPECIPRYPEPHSIKVPHTKHWNEYPVGTRAYAISGGYWVKVDYGEGKTKGWKWCTGATFPTPGGDTNGLISYPEQEAGKNA